MKEFPYCLDFHIELKDERDSVYFKDDCEVDYRHINGIVNCINIKWVVGFDGAEFSADAKNPAVRAIFFEMKKMLEDDDKFIEAVEDAYHTSRMREKWLASKEN